MPTWTRFRDRLVYKLDTFLGYPPIVQTAAVLIGTVLLVAAWAGALRLAAPDVAAGSATWWAVARFFDGGTMAGDPARARAVALGVTTTGILTLSFLTAAFASKMAERLADLRSGRGPATERDHLLVLGFDAKVALVARDLARSNRVRTLVVLAPVDKERVELGLRRARRLARRLRVVVRTGDPRSENALRRVAADRARAIVIVPPDAVPDDVSVPWSLAVLLAVRRLDFRGHVAVESRHAEARELLLLAAEPDLVGPGPFETHVVSSDEVRAKALAQASRQDGIYFTLRQLLSGRDSALFAADLPGPLLGRSFEEAHARLRGATLVGLARPGGPPILNPPAERALVLEAGDRLILVSGSADGWSVAPAPWEPARETPLSSPPTASQPEHLVVLGANRTLHPLLRELDAIMPAGSEVTIVSDALGGREAKRLLAVASPGRIHVELDPRRPVDAAREAGPLLAGATAVLVLGDEDEEGRDAGALTTLLWLRSAMHRAGRRPGRVVTEVRDPRSAAYVAELGDDFIVSDEVVGLMLAQEALWPEVAPVLREVTSPDGNELFIRPLAAYAPRGPTPMAAVAAVARARGELALGLIAPRKGWPAGLRDARRAPLEARRGHQPVWLSPPIDLVLDPAADLRVIVLAHPA